MSHSVLRLCILLILFLGGTVGVTCQDVSPDVFKQGTIPEQLKYLEDHTRIYENYRAIREDMFRNISRNTIDTLASAKKKISGLIYQTTSLNNRIDSLNKGLAESDALLEKMSDTKNSIRVLGIEVNKTTYNSVTWTILGALIFLLVLGYLTFRQNRATTVRTKKDLDELKTEFEDYQKKTRLEREKMTMDHFNEIKKLKGGMTGRG